MAAPQFATPEPVRFTEEEKDKILDLVGDLYDDGVQGRLEWEGKHELYDQMFRGKTEPRSGPWEGSSDLHVQMPYWLVDSVNVRLTAGVYNQTPLVGGLAEEDADQETFKKAANLVEYDLQAKRMNARAMWNRASKIRLIHGCSVSLLSYAADTYKYRTKDVVPEVVEDEDGVARLVDSEQIREEEGVFYDGPVMTPLEWDDFVVPTSAMNCQPNRPSNPGGADWVIVRQWEPLSLLFQKAQSAYIDMEEDRDFWINAAPSQDRSNTAGTGQNNRRVRQQDGRDGLNRSHNSHDKASARPNPEFEVMTYFGPYPDPETGEDEEMVIFLTRSPKMVLGAFRLSDLYYRGHRPLLEMHYQTVSTRFYSMGIMEIVQHLSAELDTIHNMRLDVGFATNLPFFFYRASAAFDPDEVELRPLKGIPVDNIGDVQFAAMSNVTSFYAQEEQMLYTLVERVVGVTDLFLGISPTRGAAARHATGFVGTQQEALARTSEILNQDAESFSFLCRFIYDLEMQYGPEERVFRLQGESGPQTMDLNRDALWMQGEYDFRLGANQGTYSAQVQQQQAQAMLQMAAASPLVNQDPGRRWEIEAFYLRSIGIRDPETYIGPKAAIAQTNPRSQDEENGEMAQFLYGLNGPAPVHPSDNDQEHLAQLMEFMNSSEYTALGRPNEEGYLAHFALHQRQMQAKQLQAQMQQQMAMGQQQGGQPGQPGEPGQGGGGPAPGGQDRMMAQMMNQSGGNIPGLGADQQPQASIPNPPTFPTS